MQPKKRIRAFINSVTVLCAVFVFIHVGVKIPCAFTPPAQFCEVYHRVKIITFALAIIGCYFVLWYRVFTIFYRSKSMRENLSKSERFFTFLPLVLLICMVGSCLILFLYDSAKKTTKCGCKTTYKNSIFYYKWTVLVFWNAVFQGTLLFAFIYPLYLHRKKMVNRGFDHRLFVQVIRRAAIVAFVCIVSDLLNALFAIFYNGDTVYLNHIVVSTNLLVNLMGVIMSFADWKTKIFPWKKENLKTTKPQPSVVFSIFKQNIAV